MVFLRCECTPLTHSAHACTHTWSLSLSSHLSIVPLSSYIMCTLMTHVADPTELPCDDKLLSKVKSGWNAPSSCCMLCTMCSIVHAQERGDHLCALCGLDGHAGAAPSLPGQHLALYTQCKQLLQAGITDALQCCLRMRINDLMRSYTGENCIWLSSTLQPPESNRTHVPHLFHCARGHTAARLLYALLLSGPSHVLCLWQGRSVDTRAHII